MSAQTVAKPQAAALIIEKNDIYDLLILGGGPGGLTAAIYALRAGLNTGLVERMVLGGTALATYQIGNFPGFPEGISGAELGRRLEEQAVKFGLTTIWGSTSRVRKNRSLWEVEVDGKLVLARSLVVSTGTEAAKLNVPGEAELRGKGVSYCATCDGPFYKDKNIIVIGGGNAAVEEALFLTRFGRQVSLVHRRDRLRADQILVSRAKAEPKIYFFWNSVVEEINGREKVEGVTIKDLSNKKTLKVPADGVFIYIGSRPNSSLVKELVKLDEHGYIITDETMATAAPGLFAVGDVRAKTLRQVVTAAADGAIAADSARKYLEEIDKQ